MEAPEQVSTFQFEIIKKEPINEDEINNKYENNFDPVKQEYYSKPELDLDWDEKYNVHGIDPANVDAGHNAFLKLYNPRVLLERLPDSILSKYSCLKNISVKTEDHQDDTETSTKFSENVSAGPDGKNCTLKTTNFLTRRVCSKCQKKFKSQLSLQHHLLYCGKLPHLQCSHCPYKTKYKSALKVHTSNQHLAQRRTIKRSFKHSKNLRSLKALKSDIRHRYRNTLISHKKRTVETKNKTSLNVLFKNKSSKTEHAVGRPKCNKKFKYQKSLTKHSTLCNGSSDSGNKQSVSTIKKKKYLKKQVVLKKIKNEKRCPKCDIKFMYKKPFKQHLINCKAKSYSQCKYCTYKTKYPSNLAQHVSNAHNKKKKNQKDASLVCSTCHKQFKSQYTLKVHLRHCGKSNQLQSCRQCGKLYGIRNSLIRHLEVCGKEPRFKCNHCSYKSHWKPDVAKHTAAIHLKKKVILFLPCSNCNKSFKNRQSWRRHVGNCGKEPRFQCDYCPHKSNLKSSLASHILTAHLEKDMNYFLPCSKCGKKYKNQQSLTRHEVWCGKERRLQCDYCPYKAYMKQSLRSHILAIHLEKDVNLFLPCSKCGKRYKNEISLSRHSYFCGKEPDVKCDNCPYKTKSKGSMKKHIVAVHLEKEVHHFLPCSKCNKRYKNQQSLSRHGLFCGRERHLQCDYCSYKANMKQSMKKHIVRVHLEKGVNYSLPCSKCGKRYKNQQSLTTHENLCGKEPHLQCDYCPYKSNLKASMEKHIVAVHLEKEVNHFLPCSKCGRRYKNEQSLTRHSYFCGKEADLQCNYCPYKTYCKRRLNRHVTLVHVEKHVNYFLPCAKCGKRYKNQNSLTRHSALCGKKRNFRCDHCRYTTNLKASLAKHITAVHVEKNVNLSLPCSKCGGRYKHNQSFIRHLYYCGKEHNLQCDYCSYKTNLKNCLTKHIILVHLEKETNYFLPCRKCGKKYKNEHSLRNHFVYCGKKADLKCSHCSHVTNRKTSLAKHILHVHSKKHKNSRGRSKYKNKNRNEKEK